LASPFNSCIHSIFGWIIRGVQSCFIKCVRSYGCIYPCGKNVHLSSTLVFKLSLTIGLVYIVFFGWRWNIERWKKKITVLSGFTNLEMEKSVFLHFQK
jgi:hypothetical protein